MPLSDSQQFLVAFYQVGDNGHLDVLDTNFSLVGARVFVHIWNHRQELRNSIWKGGRDDSVVKSTCFSYKKPGFGY